MTKIKASMAAMLTLAAAGLLPAHHALVQFDTTKAVWVKGTVVRFERVNPHSLLIVDQEIGNGRTQRWVVDAPAVNHLGRLPLDENALRPGSIVEACGYVTKEGAARERTISTEPISLSLKDTTPKTITGRVMNGELLVFPDGKRLPWSDYGHHFCFGPGYRDIHNR
jgi:hypothetical protein